MKSELQLRGGRFEEFARTCYEKIVPASSKMEALTIIAEYASPRIEEYSLSAIEEPDEITQNFIELIDHVIFELTENIPADSMVRQYVSDDLFARLSIYLDVFRDREIYSVSLKKRLLVHDDTVIIRQLGMKEQVPLLMAEYYEQPALQRSILQALVSFECDELLNFFYTIAKEAGSAEIKALALVGLKRCGTRFSHWRHLATDSEEHNLMIAYAQGFDCSSIEKNDIPDDLFSSMFVLQYVESNRRLLAGSSSLSWVMDLVRATLDMGYFNSYLADLYTSICNIIIFARTETLWELLGADRQVKNLVQVIDFLPREYFDRIMPKLSLLGPAFLHRVQFMLTAAKIKLDERESNTHSYLLWKTGNNL
ncbi:MAG: hypothetical protein KA369_20805 [Spirochaetes bacterium]|nr:hypothetical protein [Spirochaetota bacterium]